MTEEWRNKAACADADIDLFFPVSNQNNAYDAGRQYCARCPVRTECLDYALRSGSWHGLYGGMTPNQRQAEARRTGIKKRAYDSCQGVTGTTAGYYREKALGIPHCDECLAAYNKAANTRQRQYIKRKKAEADGIRHAAQATEQ